ALRPMRSVRRRTDRRGVAFDTWKRRSACPAPETAAWRPVSAPRARGRTASWRRRADVAQDAVRAGLRAAAGAAPVGLLADVRVRGPGGPSFRCEHGAAPLARIIQCLRRAAAGRGPPARGVGALRPGPPLWAHRPLTPTRGRHGDGLSGRLAGGVGNGRQGGTAMGGAAISSVLSIGIGETTQMVRNRWTRWRVLKTRNKALALADQAHAARTAAIAEIAEL